MAHLRQTRDKMKKLLLSGTALLSATTAFGAGLDRSGQSIALLFKDGGYVESSIGLVFPNIGSTSIVLGNNTGNATQNYLLLGGGFKADINEKLSYAVIFDQPYGADLLYPSPTLTTGSALIGGTSAVADTFAITGLMRYKLNDRFSLHGGVRAQTISADVGLAGFAYSLVGLDGYTASFASNTAFGYALGGAFEIPDIALRVALTYNSEISHDTDSLESGVVAATTTIVTPQSVNLDFQTGIMADTLLFGTVRWVNWNGFDVTPPALFAGTGASLVEYTSDYITTNIGIGRRFTDTWSAAIQLGYEAPAGGLSSPLSPSDGFWSVGVGGTYTMANTEITAGISAIKPGGTTIGIGGSPLAEMDDGIAYGLGVKVGYSF